MRSYRDCIDQKLRKTHSNQITENIFALPEVLAAETLFIYVSFRSEVQTHDLINRLLRLKKDIRIPFIDSSERMQMARFVDWDDLTPDAFGVLVPRQPVIEKKRIQAAIVPGLAFTQQGARIGYGKGHYDHFFAGGSVDTKIGIAFDCQIVEQIPTESFDQTMDYVVTEAQTFTI
jgi:5-formyltetrahydrofolate cyclo-ligase